jgi:hypothetical protein
VANCTSPSKRKIQTFDDRLKDAAVKRDHQLKGDAKLVLPPLGRRLDLGVSFNHAQHAVLLVAGESYE